jgi:hypothetical protein
VLVAHICNPNYSGGRDQEDRSSKPAQANSSERSYLEKPFKNRAGGVIQGKGPEFKLQYRTHKKKFLLASSSENIQWWMTPVQ